MLYIKTSTQDLFFSSNDFIDKLPLVEKTTYTSDPQFLFHTRSLILMTWVMCYRPCLCSDTI